jgi:hypothetical protein
LRRVSAVTSRLAWALEREDDAVLLILAGDRRGAQVLARERAVVDGAVVDLFGVLGPDDERELATPLTTEFRTYRQPADGVISGALERGRSCSITGRRTRSCGVQSR